MTISKLSKQLVEERGMPGVGVVIRRKVDSEDSMRLCSVGEFLSRSENQSGTWYIDGGWGGPPGPIRVDWIAGEWINKGFPPWEEEWTSTPPTVAGAYALWSEIEGVFLAKLVIDTGSGTRYWMRFGNDGGLQISYFLIDGGLFWPVPIKLPEPPTVQEPQA